MIEGDFSRKSAILLIEKLCARRVSILMRSASVKCFFLFIGTPFVVVFLVTYE